MSDPRKSETSQDDAPQQEPAAPDDDGGSSADVGVPFAPHEDDDTPLGDSDQHSDA